jgi:hypothetical protein
MKRDMDLIRKILFAIEEQYNPGDGLINGLAVSDYDFKTIAEHCNLLHQQGLVTSYQPFYADNTIYDFRVGNLSSKGYDYLELVRNDEIWNKTKSEVNKKKLPETIEWFAKVAGIFTGNVIKEVSN